MREKLIRHFILSYCIKTKMNQIKILMNDRSYTSWNCLHPHNNEAVKCSDFPNLESLNPIEEKLFSGDVFIYVDDKINIINSPLKSSSYIAGVLQLESNKTFGRTANNKRLLYKCIPDNKNFPVFLIPYEVKASFSKSLKNKYVVFKYDNWNDKHPNGVLVETIGDVDKIENFYEYQLYCKSLYHSITEFTNKTREQLNKQTNDMFIEEILKNSNFNIHDRRDEYIFTIDPQNSTDYDDGFSITEDENETKISIYIANVYFWMEILSLWKSFSKRVSTIYLPDRRRPMLPTVLSDTLCSLQENQLRFALVMDVFLDKDCNVLRHSYSNALIKVKKNYVYEDPKLLNKEKFYKKLFDISLKMDRNLKDSHDVVMYWMIYMNNQIGLEMIDKKIGIFRSATFVTPILRGNLNKDIDEETCRVIRSWNNVTGQYIVYNEDVNMDHEIMNLKSYVHITSPIRRLIDLLNQIIFMQSSSLVNNVSDDAREFLTNWLAKMENINASMRSIRKVQTDCTVLHRCFTNPEIMERYYKGVTFDKSLKCDGSYEYMVYLKELKMLSRTISQVEIENHKEYDFHIYLFEDEDKTKKKIRLQIVNT